MADGSLPPRFLADEDFNNDVINGLRRLHPSIDILTASEAKTLGLPDPAVLEWAKSNDRILLTHDSHTMPDHFYAFLTSLSSGEHCPGVMFVAQSLAIGRSIAAIEEVWQLSAQEEWQDLFTRLPL